MQTLDWLSQQTWDRFATNIESAYNVIKETKRCSSALLNNSGKLFHFSVLPVLAMNSREHRLLYNA